MESGTHFRQTKVVSQNLNKYYRANYALCFYTHFEKNTVMNFTSLGSQKGLEPLRYNKAKSLQKVVANIL